MITTAGVKSYFLVIVALTSVASSAVAVPYISNLVNVDSSSDSNPSSLIREATAQKAPYKVDHHLKVSEKAGDPLRIEENVNDGEQHCEMTCKYIEYQPGSNGRAAFAFTVGTPLDLSGAKKVTFFLMGENGGEKVKVKIAGKDPGAGKKGDDLLKERFELSSGEIILPNDWQRFEVPLDGVDLKNVNAPFGMDVFKGKGSAKQVVYLKYIVYEDTPVDQRFVLPANATGNATAADAIAPAANATGNTTTLTAAPAANATGNTTATEDSLAAQDNNNNNTPGQGNDNVRGNNGRGNSNNNNTNNNNTPTTPPATEVDSSDTDNETPSSAENTTADTPEEQVSNATNNTPSESPDNENMTPIAMPATNSLVAHPGDRVILDGSLSSDPDGDVITYRWSQSDGPDAEIIGADTVTPTVTIPMLEQNDQITIDLVVSDGQAESNTASVIIDVQHVGLIEGAIQQNLLLDDNIAQAEGWSDASCGSANGIVECLTDSSHNTFVSSAMPSGTTDLLFSFQDPSVAGINNNNNIAYVTAQVTAKKTGASGFTSLIVDDPNDNEHYSTPSISIVSDSFQEYSFTWNNNPATREPWTVDSLNSFVAGYRYLAGQGSIEVSEFKLIVVGIVPPVEQEPPVPPAPIDEGTSVAEGSDTAPAIGDNGAEGASDEEEDGPTTSEGAEEEATPNEDAAETEEE